MVESGVDMCGQPLTGCESITDGYNSMVRWAESARVAQTSTVRRGVGKVYVNVGYAFWVR